MREMTPEDLSFANPGFWARAKKIKLQAATFSFVDHEYQIEPMGSLARRRCYMKATQGGWTEIEVLRSLWSMIYKKHPLGDLYLFPTSDDVNEFSKSRFNPLIAANPEYIGQYVKSGGQGTDTASLKKIHNAFLYLRGARLSQRVSEQYESSKMRSIPVDEVKFDELDLMDEAVVAKARGRMGHSKIKAETYLSNPLVPGEGIDKIFQTSDQRYWFRKCSCGEETCAELFFDEDPEKCVGIRDDGTGYIRCKKCEKEVPLNNGAWIPSVPSNSDFMHGYRWSQLTSVFNDPAEILKDFRNPPEGNLADVYRLKLGLPYIAAEDRLTMAQVYACCNNDGMYSSHSGPCAMGVDVGDTKHIVIGARTGREQYQLFKIIALDSWNDIHDLAVRFNVKSAVFDLRPFRDKVMEFISKESYRAFACEYSDNPAYTRTWDDKRKIVKDYRTALFDETHRMVVTPGMLTIPRMSEVIKEFAKQMCDAYKLLETNKRTGAKQYRYKGKKEHYRNALNYFKLAVSHSGLRPIKNYRKDSDSNVISDYERI